MLAKGLLLRALLQRMVLTVTLTVMLAGVLPSAVAAANAGDEGEFARAQVAARDGDYRLVVELLTTALAADDLDEAGQVVAYSNRGIAYSLLNAYGLAKQDLARALVLNPKHELSLQQMGVLAEKVDQDYPLAVSYFQQAALAGYAPSQLSLAMMYQAGQGLARDDQQALRLCQQAAAAGYALAYTPLGEMYLAGSGTRRDPATAVKWFRLGAEAGVSTAHFLLGTVLEIGNGVAQDAQAAAAHYRVAALQGNAAAQDALGYLYRRGLGVPKDYQNALQWYRLAADQGNASAQNRLAWLLAGCPQADICDGEQAVELARRALAAAPLPAYVDSLAAGLARQGQYEQAVAELDAVLRNMSPQDPGYATYRQRQRLYQRGQPYQL